LAGIKSFSQINMKVAPKQDTHLVRLRDMVDLVNTLEAEPVRVVATDSLTNLAGSGVTVTYDSGPFTNASNQVGSGRLISDILSTPFEVDGLTIELGNRILVAGEVNETHNGIYVVAAIDGSGFVLERTFDFNDALNIRNGLVVPVLAGDTYADTRWETVLGDTFFVLHETEVEFSRIIVDITRVVEMTFDIEGDDTTMIYNITHDLDSMNVTHEIYDDEGDTVLIEFRRVSANALRLSPGAPLGIGNDLVLVIRAEVSPD